MRSLLLLCMAISVSFATITEDMDIHHGHSEEYFKNLKVPKGDVLQIHIVPHTHDDVGWLKTVDEYFTGSNNKIQHAGVQYVISTVVQELIKDPSKKFTYVEMAFFKRWWLEQSDEIRKEVQILVDGGRLQFVNAGISMSDEATVHYEDFLNNMKAGHDFLKETLGYRPTIGWHIDPFGHHSASAALFAEMGFNAWFFARMDYQDKAARLANKEMEWIWRPFNESLGSRAEIFTHMMYQHYSAPQGFGFWADSTDEPVVDDPRLETYNVEERSKELYDYLIHMADHYKTNHLLVPFGDDFKWENAAMTYFNIDKLIKYMNENYDDVNLFYSTPNDYVDALNKLDAKWPTKYDDLFPYADQSDVYWTGFFTSRPNIKGYVREASSDMIAHAACLELDFLIYGEDTFDAYDELFEQMGVLQHHDAVSGTEKQATTNDYNKVLTKKLDGEKEQFLKSFKKVSGTSLNNLAMCSAHNSTYVSCPTKVLAQADVKELGLHISNPSNQRKTIAQIPIPVSNLDLFLEDGTPVMNDIICSKNSMPSKSFTKDHEEDGCHMYFEFEASAFGGHIYKLQKTNTENHIEPIRNKGKIDTEKFTMEISSIRTDVKMKFTRPDLDEPENVQLDYMYYTPFAFPFMPHDSGAYIFRPMWPSKQASRYNSFSYYESYKGQVVQQFRLYGSRIDTIITGHSLTDFVEIETQHKGIKWDVFGKEVTIRLTNDNIKNKKTFYTDSMGLEMQKRILDYRPTWNLVVSEPIAGNFYPVGHGIYIQDDQRTLELLNDRSQGGSSLKDGQVELMIHRRLYYDDHKGLSEALDESDSSSWLATGVPVTTKHYFRFYKNTTPHSAIENSRWMQRQIDCPLVYVYGDLVSNTQNFKKSFYGSGFKDISLPDEVKMVILPQKDGSLFLRLENTFDLISSNTVATVDVDSLSASIAELAKTKVKKVTEVSNTGLYTMNEMKDIKIHWNTLDYQTPIPDYTSDTSNVELSPQRIRSFIVEFKQSMNIQEYLKSF